MNKIITGFDFNNHGLLPDSPKLKPNSPVSVVQRYINIHGDDDICINCTSEMIEVSCNKCGEGVCTNDSCCMIFPDRYDKLYIICNNCAKAIDKKLKLLIDMSKLDLLKRKILNFETKIQSRQNSIDV